MQKCFHHRHGDPLRGFVLARGTGETDRTTMFVTDVWPICKNPSDYLTNLCNSRFLCLHVVGRWALALEIGEPLLLFGCAINFDGPILRQKFLMEKEELKY